MDHTLTVGEIYDKAIDLCLRNAGKIAIALGVVFLVSITLSHLGDPSGDDSLLKGMHLPPHGASATIWWLTGLATLISVFSPVASAAICVIFDRALRGEYIGLKVALSSPARRVANVIVASFLSSVYFGVPALAIYLAYFLAFRYIGEPAVNGALVLTTLGFAMWFVGLLAIGALMGFARVALDGGRVIASLRLGITLAFAKANRRRALGVGIPMLLLLAVGSFGGIYAGGVIYSLTGVDAANWIVQSISQVSTWSLMLAVATVYYRNLTPVA